jgi:PII-like signaling protein
VSEDCLKLTSYFGERDRLRGRALVGDELLDLYGARRVRASVLLRGAEGFGAHHRLRTDRQLSLSEDLPAVAVAVDTRERIEGLLDDVQAIQRRGLVTLERAQRVRGGGARGSVESEEAVKLTVYIGRRQRIGGRAAFVALCELLHRAGVDGASVLLGVDGTRGGRRQRARFFAANADVPMMIVAVGSGERIAAVLGELAGLLAEPLLTIERVRVCKRDGELLSAPHALPRRDGQGRELWQKLTVYCSQAAGLNLELVRRLRASGAAGATSVRGVWGFHGAHAPHGERFLQLRRHVPVVTVTVDAPERIGRAFWIVDQLTARQGLVTSEPVPAIGLGERGLRLVRQEP